ncbi:Na+/H+ antiporter subunit G [Pseudooceanicola sp.]|uniref:Na+/H+ antiporter subunit G n=1 Tax=Pseudooceanicola sp. TaxID=1914328 RepID=UPI0035131629
MDVDLLIEFLVAFCLVVSGVFGFVGSFGLLKLRDTMQRLHSPTKASTLGVGGVLVASMVYFVAIKGDFTFHELLISLFLFLTAPISANFIAKTYLTRSGRDEELPATASEYGWSIHDDPPQISDQPKE